MLRFLRRFQSNLHLLTYIFSYTVAHGHSVARTDARNGVYSHRPRQMRPGVVPATTSRPDTVTDSVRHTTQAHKRARAGLAHAELTHRRERPHTEHEPPRAMLPRVRRISPSCTHAANRTAASRTNHRRPAAHPGSDGAHASAASHASRAAESRYDCVKEPRSGESLQCNQHR